ncbi:MAG: hypothetical protein AABM29_07205 [Actinomycetota bacterium]
MTGFDFADPERGLSGTVRRSGAALLFDHEDVLAASPEASVELGDSDDTTSARVSLDGVTLELELAPVGQSVSLETEGLGAEEMTVCRVLGELRRDGAAEEVACLGVRSAGGSEPDFSQLELTRSVAVAFSDGGMLALRAARPRGAQGHGDERTAAVVASADGEVTRIEQALLSTQYDEAGRHVRATLELWAAGPEPGPPLRAAGSIVCGTSLALGDQRLDVAFFRWSISGRPGLGRYEVLAGQGD